MGEGKADEAFNWTACQLIVPSSVRRYQLVYSRLLTCNFKVFHWISFSKISILVTWSCLCSIVFWIWTEGASMSYFNISLFVLFSQHPKIKWNTSRDVFSAEVESVETRRKTRGTWNLVCWSAHGALVQRAHSRDSAVREKRHIDLLQGFLCFTYLQYVHLFSVQKAF